MNVPFGPPLVYRLILSIFPAVDAELGRWRRRAELAPDSALKMQALSSIGKKRFHCLGGSVFSLYPGAAFDACLRFIVAFQTISDYLDNLCDRAGVQDEEAFRQLHLSMLDSVDPEATPHCYYRLYPHQEDGGYLEALVEECREQVRKLPSFSAVRDRMKALVSLYSELQALKHAVPASREEKLRRWATPLAQAWPGISPWEYCAAAGSTLGVFLLIAAASKPGLLPPEADALMSAYFPWVCGLHILLDYFIDREEDIQGGDFNFTSYYSDAAECAQRLSFFTEQALPRCRELGHAGFHCTVVRGLLALYLSDPKAESMKKDELRELLRRGGVMTNVYHMICRGLRKAGKLS